MKFSQILLLIISFFITSCFARSDKDPSAVPKRNMINFDNSLHHFKDALKDSTPDFRQGWYDGCETGMHSGDNSFYKMFSKSNKQDGWKMVDSPDYKVAWNYAYWYCYRSQYIDQKEGVWGSFFGIFH